MVVKICLNMIVKNETKVIGRLFDSVYGIINYYFICDTGSTDGTIQFIENYFEEKGIPGTVIYKKFVDFGTNRTYSLKMCKESLENSSEWYMLFMDADMVLKVGNLFDKNKLTKDVYNLQQGNNTFVYSNTRMVKCHLDTTAVCPTHFTFVYTRHWGWRFEDE